MKLPEIPFFRVEKQSPPKMIASENQLLISENGQIVAEYTRTSQGSWFCRFPEYDDPGTGNMLPLDSPENLHISYLYHSARKS